MSPKPILDVLGGKTLSSPPVWMMRQAGRYLPEYREVRAQAGSFLDLCYTPNLAKEVTLQPIRRFGMDAAILFSDILIIPHALGLQLNFVQGEGPQLETIRSRDELSKLSEKLDPSKIGPVYEALSLIGPDLPSQTTLIGFVGGPWTVATYIVCGKGSPDHAEARAWAFRDPDGFQELIDRLTQASVDHLLGQIEAGAEAVQIFDSWAGELPDPEFRRWSITPIRTIVDKVRQKHPGFPIIVFPRASGSKLALLGEVFHDVALGLDTAESPEGVQLLLPRTIPVQGNLDPLVLVAGGRRLDEEVDRIKRAFSTRPHIFNLGHGIRQETPIEHVERFVARVRESF